MKKHKPEMLAEWAKENRIRGWEHYWRAYAPSEVQKRRQRSIKEYNKRKWQEKNELRQTFKKGR